MAMEKLVIKSEALQEEITAEREEIERMINSMEENIESLHQQKGTCERVVLIRLILYSYIIAFHP